MKTILIILGVIFVAFLIFQAYFMYAQKDIEMHQYKTVKTIDDIEIRKYESALFTSIKLQTSDYDKAGTEGFNALGGYIFGNNETKENIAMTSPVNMSLEDSVTMQFMVPKQYNKEDLPKPNQSNIEFKQMPEKTVAAISFGGWADKEKIEKYKSLLKETLDKNSISYTNKFSFLGYNAPFEVFNRKNEVIVELK
ncbi:SOUL family heme-binding protein [Lacinutrix jangbogonensis]|uniref:SOUL family heme-binding protein n=1 Tax=Lacinutrix jangbogonensis TaxID=1469557 RepID=UPI00053E2396|nr:heme-binding protein [Lacinutrix jangbogonensis]